MKTLKVFLEGDLNIFLNSNLGVVEVIRLSNQICCKINWSNRLLIYVIPGELEILKWKGLLSDDKTVQTSYKDAWITFLFQTACKNLF